MEKKDREKKQIPLRLPSELYAEIAAWAEDEFRSVNGQIEYLLTDCVRKRRSAAGARAGAPDDQSETK